MKRILIIVFSLILATAAGAAPAGPVPGGPQSGGPNGGPPGGPGAAPGPNGAGEVLTPEALAVFLGLTEGQQAQIVALHETLRSTVGPLQLQLDANRDAIEAALEARNSTEAGALLLASYDLREQIDAAHDAFLAAARALLTDEQQVKWDLYQQIVTLHNHPPQRPNQGTPQG